MKSKGRPKTSQISRARHRGKVRAHWLQDLNPCCEAFIISTPTTLCDFSPDGSFLRFFTRIVCGSGRRSSQCRGAPVWYDNCPLPLCFSHMLRKVTYFATSILRYIAALVTDVLCDVHPSSVATSYNVPSSSSTRMSDQPY